jgi:hypothetical protein
MKRPRDYDYEDEDEDEDETNEITAPPARRPPARSLRTLWHRC